MNTKITLMVLMTFAITTSAIAGGMNKQGMNQKGAMRAVQQPTFSQLDLNSDGQVSPQELTDFRAQRISERANEGRTLKNISNAKEFSDYDTNNDGFISEQEFLLHKRSAKSAWRNKS